jgi:hypothetical protein
MIKHKITQNTKVYKIEEKLVGEKMERKLEKSNIGNRKEGEQIETKIMRITENKEPITDGSPMIYTERNQGVLPAYNIKADRFDIAIDAMDYVTKSAIAKRDGISGEPNKIVENESTQGTE